MTGRDSGGSSGSDRAVEPKVEQDERNETMRDEALPDGIDEELREFLAADLLDVPVDPAFKERLRRELWELVERNAEKWRAQRPTDDEEPGH